MEYRHVKTIREGIEVGDIYKMFVFEESKYEHTPYGPDVSIYAHDYDGYLDDEGTHHNRFVWVKSRGKNINVAITEEHFVPDPERQPETAEYTDKDGNPLKIAESTLMEEEFKFVQEQDIYQVIERFINGLE